MRKLAIVLVPLLVLPLVVGAVGCGGGEGTATPTPTATPTSADGLPTVDEVIANIAAAQGEVTSWRADISMGTEIEVSGPEGGRTTQSQSGRAAIDLLDREMEMHMSISIVAPDEEMDTQTAVYFVGDTLYMMTIIPGIGEQWTKQPLSGAEVDEFWDMFAKGLYPSLQADFMEACNLDLVSVEEAGGVSCYLLEGSPDMEALFDLIVGTGLGQPLPFEVSDMFQDARISYWVSTDTYLLVQSEMTATISMERMDTKIAGEIEQTSLFYDYGKEIDIEVPPEATSAADTPGTQSPTAADFETFSKYGFSLRYPKGFSVTEKGALSSEADDSSGLVRVSRTYGTGLLTEATEQLEVIWFPQDLLEAAGSLERLLESSLDHMEDTLEGWMGAEGLEFERGELVESTKAGHPMLYQYWCVTDAIDYRAYGSDKACGILGAFYCDKSGKVFFLATTNTTISAKADVLEDFMTYLDSFVCH